MTQKSNETRLAEHEIRIATVERMLPKIDVNLEQINKKLDESFVSYRVYEKYRKDQDKFNTGVQDELNNIADSMMTREEFKDFSRSQFWQKLMTFLGGVGSAVIMWLLFNQLSILMVAT